MHEYLAHLNSVWTPPLMELLHCAATQQDWSTHVHLYTRMFDCFILGTVTCVQFFLCCVGLHTVHVCVHVFVSHGSFVAQNKGDTWLLYYVLLSRSLVPRLSTSHTRSENKVACPPEVSTIRSLIRSQHVWFSSFIHCYTALRKIKSSVNEWCSIWHHATIMWLGALVALCVLLGVESAWTWLFNQLTLWQ